LLLLTAHGFNAHPGCYLAWRKVLLHVHGNYLFGVFRRLGVCCAAPPQLDSTAKKETSHRFSALAVFCAYGMQRESIFGIETNHFVRVFRYPPTRVTRSARLNSIAEEKVEHGLLTSSELFGESVCGPTFGYIQTDDFGRVLWLPRTVNDSRRDGEPIKQSPIVRLRSQHQRARSRVVLVPQADQVQARVDLELKFKRGEIGAKEFIEQSGAVKEYLTQQGVDLESLREATNTHFEQSWAAATDEFLNSPEGSSWPGAGNLQVIQNLLTANHLEDAEDKVGALKACFQHMKENDLVQENPELTRTTKISQANSVDEIREALGRPDFSTIFGR
jgi:hypothetical protein